MNKGWGRFDERGLEEILYAPSTYSAERKRQEQYVCELLGSKNVPESVTGKKKLERLRKVAVLLFAAVSIIAAMLCLVLRAPATAPQSAAGAGGIETVEELAVNQSSRAEENSGENATGRKSLCYTILAVGRDSTGANTDTILVGLYDKEQKIFNVVSIPRDTLVNVSWNVKKINSIYGQEGISGLENAIRGLFGYRADQWALVELDAFETLIDEVGGVWFDVPVEMNYDDPTQNLSIHYTAGYQHLTGYDAMCVFRFRQNSDGTGYLRGDLDRIETQHALLSALSDQAFSPEVLFDLDGIAEIVSENVDTSLTTSNILWYGGQMLTMDKQNIRFYTMPVHDVTLGSLSYVYPDVDAWLQMLNDSLNPYNDPITKEDLHILYQDDGGVLCMTDGTTPYTNFY